MLVQIRASDAVRRRSRNDEEETAEKVEAEGDPDADITGSTSAQPWATSTTDRHPTQRPVPPPSRLSHRRYPVAQGLLPGLPPGRRWRRQRVGQSVPGARPVRVGAEVVPEEAGDHRESVGGPRRQPRRDSVRRRRDVDLSREAETEGQHLWDAAGRRPGLKELQARVRRGFAGFFKTLFFLSFFQRKNHLHCSLAKTKNCFSSWSTSETCLRWQDAHFPCLMGLILFSENRTILQTV